MRLATISGNRPSMVKVTSGTRILEAGTANTRSGFPV
jgi:hypothetical protein